MWVPRVFECWFTHELTSLPPPWVEALFATYDPKQVQVGVALVHVEQALKVDFGFRSPQSFKSLRSIASPGDRPGDVDWTSGRRWRSPFVDRGPHDPEGRTRPQPSFDHRRARRRDCDGNCQANARRKLVNPKSREPQRVAVARQWLCCCCSGCVSLPPKEPLGAFSAREVKNGNDFVAMHLLQEGQRSGPSKSEKSTILAMPALQRSFPSHR